MREPILERLAAGDVLVADGATGTMLQSAGLPTGMPGEAWILARPDVIVDLHRAYLEAGSHIVLTSTFGGTRARLQAAGLEAKVEEINHRAAELAREAAGQDRYVGGDIGPSGDRCGKRASCPRTTGRWHVGFPDRSGSARCRAWSESQLGHPVTGMPAVRWRAGLLLRA